MGNVNKQSFPKDGVLYVLGIWMVSGAVPYYGSEYWITVLVLVVPVVCKTDDTSMECPTLELEVVALAHLLRIRRKDIVLSYCLALYILYIVQYRCLDKRIFSLRHAKK